MKLDDERRKLLTKYLGECFFESKNPNEKYTRQRCLNCKKSLDGHVKNRTFTTDTDMMALFRRMVDNKEWFNSDNNFWDYAFYIWQADRSNDKQDYSAWLFYIPERFCFLVSKWLREEKK